MTALLKAMGVVLWSLAAIGLLVVGGMIGLKALHPDTAGRAVDSPPGMPSALPAIPSAINDGALAEPSAGSASDTVLQGRAAFDPALGRRRFAEAIVRHDASTIIEYGRRLHDHGMAGPEDFTEMALAFSTLGDCSNALAWIDKADATPAPLRRDAAATRVRALCRPAPAAAPPQSAGGRSGNHDVHIGELFYAVNDYSRAILFLQKGLGLGGVTHADEAYVYLGRSYLALHQDAEACQAFDMLTQVPDASPRVVKLWTLFADTHCMTAAAH